MNNSRVMCAFAVVLGLAVASGAATINVTSDADSGAGTLRAAITTAEGNGQADVITFDSDMTILLASPLPNITTAITIQGLGWQHTIIDGGNPTDGTSGVQIFVITSTGNLTLDGVLLQNAYGADLGGAVVNGGVFLFQNSYAATNAARYGGFLANWGDAELANAVVLANHAQKWGGGISNSNSLKLTRTVLVDNVSDGDGGGIWTHNGVVLGFDSLFEGNSAFTVGGAVSAPGPTNMRFANCTFDLNAASSGAAVSLSDASAEALLSNCTVTANTGESLSGGSGTLYVRDSIIAGNSTTNCSAVSSAGGNIEDTDTCGGSTVLGDLVDTDPLLGPRTELDHGIPDITYYYPPTATSPAVDSSTHCSWDDDANPLTPEVPLTEDQRRFSRPWDGDGDGVAICDRGAVEYHGLMLFDGFEGGDTSAWSATVQ